MSLSNGEIPNKWRKARVTPVYKNKGSKQDPNNFRPISVIEHIPKLFEKLVDSQLIEYLQSDSFITHSQSAFMKLHSTQMSLHNVIEYVLDNINKNEINGICMFDLAKCFDTIDHELLFKKLSKYGLTGTELQWFTNYLNERTQVVTISGEMSNTKLIDKGVPQGSILGPLLFTIFINDFPSCLSIAFCNIFADDTMIGVSDKSITKIQQLLQNAVNEAIKWFGQNKLTLNINKCNVLIISNKNIVHSIDIFINGVKLPFVKSAKYLGVEIDSKLSWSNHIDGLCKKLSAQLYILRKLKQIFPTDDINCVYYGIFQSIIDYCITVWGSAAQKYLCKIQK